MSQSVFTDFDRKCMHRALQLARAGLGHTSPNPMVGAVIAAPDGRIIGEGWHRHFGGPHAEVNAVRSVREADLALLPQSTIYVTLEPCSHYGKTPPCAKMLCECRFRRVVIAAGDPNPKVSGRGVRMLRDAGITVDEGLMEKEARELNRAFMTSQILRRPFVTLKWAQSADGFMDARRSYGEGAYRFSIPLTSQLVHWRRALHDAIAVGARTVLADRPRLDVRLIEGQSPRPVVFDRHCLISPACLSQMRSDAIVIDSDEPLADVMHRLYADFGISSLLVEGGAGLLRSFLAAGLWDEAWVEVSHICLGHEGAVMAPAIAQLPEKTVIISHNSVNFYSHYGLCGVKNI